MQPGKTFYAREIHDIIHLLHYFACCIRISFAGGGLCRKKNLNNPGCGAWFGDLNRSFLVDIQQIPQNCKIISLITFSYFRTLHGEESNETYCPVVVPGGSCDHCIYTVYFRTKYQPAY